MPRENKSLAVVRKRMTEVRIRLKCSEAELAILTAIESEMSAVKPKRVVKPNWPEANQKEP